MLRPCTPVAVSVVLAKVPIQYIYMNFPYISMNSLHGARSFSYYYFIYICNGQCACVPIIYAPHEYNYYMQMQYIIG